MYVLERVDADLLPFLTAVFLYQFPRYEIIPKSAPLLTSKTKH